MEMLVMISGQAIWLFEIGQSTETEKFRLLLFSPVLYGIVMQCFHSPCLSTNRLI